MATAKITWNDALRIRLLFALVEVGDVGGKWELAATKMGPGFTAESIR
jgi:hypothetical protein